MAAGDTAPASALSSSPAPPLLDRSSSAISSPLSDVEDKDGEPDELNLDGRGRGKTTGGSPEPSTEEEGEEGEAEEEGHTGDGTSRSEADSDEDGSKLSDVDIDDSEAETERLYNTPPKKTASHGETDGVGGSPTTQHFLNRRDRTFEHSPSKLQHQLQANAEDPDKLNNDNNLSPREDEGDDGVSTVSSDAEAVSAETAGQKSSLPGKRKRRDAVPDKKQSATADNAQSQADSKKRKRSLIAEPPEAEQPLRKRTGSIAPLPDREMSTGNAGAVDEEDPSTGPHSAEQSDREDSPDDVQVASKTRPRADGEDGGSHSTPPQKLRRNGVKILNGKPPIDDGGGDEPSHTDATREDGADGTGRDVALGVDLDHQDADVDMDEEIEAAHRNEEELERKKAAFDELAAIEKQFTNFRDKLYQERLEQLDREEAMLMADEPSHPEYLAMLECIDKRRDEKIRLGALEYSLKMGVLKQRVRAERTQIMSQFYQTIREEREKTLEDLGAEWYQIQHERRRFANNIPDFGIRIPSTKSQSVRYAIQYNKEVSILAGLAKHKGFPAAPPMNGASDDQVDADFEAIGRARLAAIQQPPTASTAFQAELKNLPFGRTLGPAGEQFLEQTPWANPNHPAHQAQRRRSQQEPADSSTDIVATTSTGPVETRRHSHHPPSGASGPKPGSNAPLVNGNGSDSNLIQISHSSVDQELVKGGKILSESLGLKREGVTQAS